MTWCDAGSPGGRRGDVVVGVDLGTTAAKAVVLGPAADELGSASLEYPTRYVGGSGAEQDPADWWRASASCIRDALDVAGVAAQRVAAVGVSSQAPSVVVVDADGEPVHPALLWMDRRGADECDRRGAAAADVLARTGNRIDPYYAAPKLAWLRAADPDAAGRGRTVLMASGYIVHRLTGVACVDTGHVGLSLLGDLATGSWVPGLAELWGIPAGWLPPAYEPATVVGRVRTGAAAVTGLAAGTPVIAGAVDGVTASLAAGLVRHGDVGEMSGQSTVVNAPFRTELLRADRLGALSVMPYPVSGHHLVFGAMVATGGILRWFRDEFGRYGPDSGDVESFADLDDLAGSAPPGGNGLVLLPYFLGERSPIWDVDARGALVGLSMGTRRADVVRAIFEGAAYGLAHNLLELTRLGLHPTALRIVGGGALARTWNQIKADVTGLPVEVPAHSFGAPAGAGLLAAFGVGLVTDLATAAATRPPGEVVRPDRGRQALYARYQEVYRELYPALRATYEKLAALRTP